VAGLFTCEDLIASIRRRAFLPRTENGEDYPLDQDIIDVVNEEVPGWLVPFVLSHRQGHFSAKKDIALVAGQAEYLVPSRAAGADISFAQIVDSSGNVLVSELPQEDAEIATQHLGSGPPAAYFFRGNAIVLVPTPAASVNSLRLEYPQGPNQLTLSTHAGVVTSVTQNSGSFRVAYSGSPAGFSVGLAFEVVHAKPGFEIVALGACTGTGSGYLDFAGTVPSGVNVADFLCLEDTAPVLTNVPKDILPLVCQWVAVRLLGDRGTEEQFDRASKIFQALEERAKEYLGKRDRNAHHKIVARPRRRLPAMLYRG
jgi:hypothetical protein